jgi:hypothetical protein
MNSVPGVTGPSVKVVVDGLDQPTALCGQAVGVPGPPCDYLPGTRPDPPTKVFCGKLWSPFPEDPADPLPFVIVWGNPPPDYKATDNPGESNSTYGAGDSIYNLSSVVFDPSSDTKVLAGGLNLNEPGIEYAYIPSKGNTVQTTKTGKTWHFTGALNGSRPGASIGNKPFDVTVTCP